MAPALWPDTAVRNSPSLPTSSIRDAVQTRALLFSSLGLLLLASAPTLVMLLPASPLAWSALPVAVAGLACVLRPYMLRCPRCEHRFSMAIGQVASFPGSHEAKECPGCHCNLDEAL